RESLCCFPISARDRHDHVNALAPRQLDKTLKLLRLEPIARLLRRRDDLLPTYALTRIEIEDDPVALFQSPQTRTANVNLQSPKLSKLDQIAQLLHRDHVMLFRLNDVAERRVLDVRSDVLLEKALPGDAVRASHDGERPIDQVRSHEFPDVDVVVRQILLGDPGIGPIDPI